MSSEWKAVCYDSQNKPSPLITPCKAYFKESISSPKIKWFTSCLAKGIVSKNFQLPVYLVHDNNPSRYNNIVYQCNKYFIKKHKIKKKMQ